MIDALTAPFPLSSELAPDDLSPVFAFPAATAEQVGQGIFVEFEIFVQVIDGNACHFVSP